MAAQVIKFGEVTGCPLCGFKFIISDATCSGCAINGSCETLKCPQCNYEFVEKSAIVSFFQKIFSKKKKIKLDDLRLSHVGRGRYEVSEIITDNFYLKNKLYATGIFPGMIIDLLQKQPSMLIKMGKTEMGIDAEVAHLIQVTVPKI